MPIVPKSSTHQSLGGKKHITVSFRLIVLPMYLINLGEIIVVHLGGSLDGLDEVSRGSRLSIGRVGEFPDRFLRRLAVTDIVVAVTVGGTAILVIIAYVAGGQHDFSRRSNFIIYKFFLMQINLRYCLIFFGIMQNSLVARFSEYFKY